MKKEAVTIDLDNLIHGCSLNGLLRTDKVSDQCPKSWRKYLFDEGEGDKVPGNNTMIHQFKEGSESEGQHFTKASGQKEK